jgi:hypothetical protein
MIIHYPFRRRQLVKWVIRDHRFDPPIEQEIECETWNCPYCGWEIGEHGACCGEVGHAERNLRTADQYYGESELSKDYLEVIEEYEPRDPQELVSLYARMIESYPIEKYTFKEFPNYYEITEKESI